MFSVFLTLFLCAFTFVSLDNSSINDYSANKSRARATRSGKTISAKFLASSNLEKLQQEKNVHQIATEIKASRILPPLDNVRSSVKNMDKEANSKLGLSILRGEANNVSTAKKSDIKNTPAAYPNSHFDNLLHPYQKNNNSNIQVTQIWTKPVMRVLPGIKIKANFRKKILVSNYKERVVEKTYATKRLLSAMDQASNDKKRSSIPFRPTLKGISSNFGKRIDPINNNISFHKGIDVPRPRGTKVFSWSDGVVTRNGWMRGYGRTVDVTHVNGQKTRYAHLKRTNVIKGQKINKGQIIGQVGKTGRTTGPNLHFEITIGGKNFDPLHYLTELEEIVDNRHFIENG